MAIQQHDHSDVSPTGDVYIGDELKKLLGPHLGGRWTDKLELLRKWQPSLVSLSVKLLFSPTTTTATLFHHVGSIVCWSSEEQMRRIDTIPDIAAMQNPETIRNRTIVDFIGNAVRSKRFSAMHDLSIAKWVGAGRPKPALVFVAFVYAFPELLGNFHALTMSTKIALWLSLHMTSLMIRFGGNAGLLAATAHAKTRWIWIWIWHGVMASIGMAYDIARGLSFDVSFFRSVCPGNWGKLTTTTMTVAVRNLVRGIIGEHQKFTFLGLIRRRVASTLAGLFAFSTPVIIPRVSI